jgi:hypothetical protein
MSTRRSQTVGEVGQSSKAPVFATKKVACTRPPSPKAEVQRENSWNYVNPKRHPARERGDGEPQTRDELLHRNTSFLGLLNRVRPGGRVHATIICEFYHFEISRKRAIG